MAADDLPAAEPGDGVVERPADRVGVAIGVADDDVNAAVDTLGNLLHRAEVVVDELRLEQQILRRVADDRQLREDDEVRATRFRAGRELDRPADVAGNVADGRIGLGERDSHGTIRSVWRGTRVSYFVSAACGFADQRPW